MVMSVNANSPSQGLPIDELKSLLLEIHKDIKKSGEDLQKVLDLAQSLQIVAELLGRFEDELKRLKNEIAAIKSKGCPNCQQPPGPAKSV